MAGGRAEGPPSGRALAGGRAEGPASGSRHCERHASATAARGRIMSSSHTHANVRSSCFAIWTGRSRGHAFRGHQTSPNVRSSCFATRTGRSGRLGVVGVARPPWSLGGGAGSQEPRRRFRAHALHYLAVGSRRSAVRGRDSGVGSRPVGVGRLPRGSGSERKHLAARGRHLAILRQVHGPSPFVATDRGSWRLCRTSKAAFSVNQLAAPPRVVATRGDASSECRKRARCSSHVSCWPPVLPTTIWPSGGGSRPSAVGSRQSAIGSRRSAVGYGPSAVGSRQSAVGSRLSAVGCGPSAVGCGLWAVGSRQSAVVLLSITCLHASGTLHGEGDGGASRSFATPRGGIRLRCDNSGRLGDLESLKRWLCPFRVGATSPDLSQRREMVREPVAEWRDAFPHRARCGCLGVGT